MSGFALQHSTVAITFPNSPFRLAELYSPAGDQPEAIAQLIEGIEDGLAFQTLLGVTGSGKTFTMANVIGHFGRPALVLAPNKTLAAQLYSEFREFFPENAVEYFVSYYDYYQPEAYVPARDLYIEKDSSINEHIEQMRLSATKSLMERRDAVIVATVSAIYGIGDPSEYHGMILHLRRGAKMTQRARFDLEMLAELGFCKGIENYSRHLSGRQAGEPPPTLIDYLPQDALMIIDESHVTIPQLGGMYKGDRSRKENLVEYGFRLPSALDNRPLRFDEFEKVVRQTVFVSATPADYERQHSGQVVEQVVRPTGLIDPQVVVRPASTQVDDLLSEINFRVKKQERVLVTTLTKRMAEELTDYLAEHGVKVRYLHSEVETVERVEIIRDLRLGEFDVLVGINLLREGLDLPEVSLVAILDADKEGFLRSERSLILTMGRSARHINGMAILYADRETDSIKRAIAETDRRRRKQVTYNERHSITPKGVIKRIKDLIDGVYDASEMKVAEER